MDRDILVSGVGERRLVDLFMELLGDSGGNILPHPDDAVAVRFDGSILVFKTDMFVASTDMPPKMKFYDVGWKTVIMNVSDLACKGAIPLYFLSSIGMPKEFKLKDSLDIMRGIRDAASEYEVKVLGGDVGECDDLVVSGFLIGSCPSGQLMSRRGAKPGDLVAVTGCFGLTSAALKTFMQDLKVDSNLLRAFKDAMFKPKARVKEGVALARCGAVTASIDSSDGLLESLQELAKVNNIGFIIEELPVCGDVKRFAEMFGYDLLDLVFRGGEEYELVLTLRPGYLDEALKAMRSVGGDLKIIGRVVEKQGVFFNEENGRVELKGDGYEHFKKRS